MSTIESILFKAYLMFHNSEVYPKEAGSIINSGSVYYKWAYISGLLLIAE